MPNNLSKYDLLVIAQAINNPIGDEWEDWKKQNEIDLSNLLKEQALKSICSEAQDFITMMMTAPTEIIDDLFFRGKNKRRVSKQRVFKYIRSRWDKRKTVHIISDIRKYVQEVYA